MSDPLKLLMRLQSEVRALEENVERVQELRQELASLESRLAERKVVLLQGHVLSVVGKGRFRVSLATGERAYLESERVFAKGDAFSLNAVCGSSMKSGEGGARVFREATPDDHLFQMGLQEHFLEIKLRLARLEAEVFGVPGKVN